MIEKLADFSIMRYHDTKTKTQTRLIKFPNEPMRTENERQKRGQTRMNIASDNRHRQLTRCFESTYSFVGISQAKPFSIHTFVFFSFKRWLQRYAEI